MRAEDQTAKEREQRACHTRAEGRLVGNKKLPLPGVVRTMTMKARETII